MFEECLAMVRCDHNHRLVKNPLGPKAIHKHTDILIHPVQRTVVDVRERAAVFGRRLVVEVLVNIHVVQIEKEPLIAIPSQELHPGLGRIKIRARKPMARRTVPASPIGGPVGRGPIVEIKTSIKTEIVGHPAVAPNSGRSEFFVLKDLCG